LMISCLQIKSPIEQAQLRRDISESRRWGWLWHSLELGFGWQMPRTYDRNIHEPRLISQRVYVFVSNPGILLTSVSFSRRLIPMSSANINCPGEQMRISGGWIYD
jgi:hypothetical protein